MNGIEKLKLEEIRTVQPSKHKSRLPSDRVLLVLASILGVLALSSSAVVLMMGLK